MDFKEESITIVGNNAIGASLTIPEGIDERFPAILMIHGTGPIDRNASAVKILKNYKNLVNDPVDSETTGYIENWLKNKFYLRAL